MPTVSPQFLTGLLHTSFLTNQEPYYQTGGGAIIAGCGLTVIFALMTKWYCAKKNKALKAAEDANGEPEGWRYAG